MAVVATMRIFLQPAFILHRRPYRNTSLLVEALTWEHGRVGLVARGVRTPRSRLKGLLQPFVPLLLSWSGKGELLNLTAVEEAEKAIPIPPIRLFSGFYINELLLRLLQRHDPHAGLFKPYQQVLKALSTAANEEAALRVFEKQLLKEIGYGLVLDSEVLTGAPIVANGVYRYILDRGPVAAEQAGPGIIISGKSLLALRHEVIQDPLVLRETKRLTRKAIELHLQGRPLKTRAVVIASQRRRQAV